MTSPPYCSRWPSPRLPPRPPLPRRGRLGAVTEDPGDCLDGRQRASSDRGQGVTVLDYDTAMAVGASRYGDVLRLLAAAGLAAAFTQTGGMNAALEVLLDGGHTLLITDAQDSLSWDRAEHHSWGVGLYPPDQANADGDCLAFDSTDDGSAEALVPLARAVLSDYTRSRRA